MDGQGKLLSRVFKMADTMQTITLVLSVLLFLSQKEADAVMMRITPTTVTVGGDQISNTPYPTTTPTTVILQCSPQGTGSLNGVFSLYISRRRTSESQFTNIAEIDNINNQPMRSQYAPNDITQKNPTITGNVKNGISSQLTVTFMVDRLDCADSATYRCKMNYKPVNGETDDVYTDSSLTVRVLPGNLQMTVTQTSQAFPQQFINNTDLPLGTALQFTCTGSIGDSTSTQIGWKRMFSGNFGAQFQQYSPTNPGDLNQGNPTSSCPYTRTSTLRYVTSSDDQLGTAFHCDVTVSNTGVGLYTAQSQDIYFTSGAYLSAACPGHVINLTIFIGSLLFLVVAAVAS